MNRNHLLNLAGLSVYFKSAALDLALRLKDARDVQRAVEHYSSRLAVLNMVGTLCLGLFVASTVALILASFCMVADRFPGLEHLADPVACANAIAAGLFVMLAAAVAGAAATAKCGRVRERLDLLAPVICSPACQSALEYVDAGEPEVLAWRDLAVAERDVLYAFDLSIMRDIHYAVLAPRDATRIQNAQEAACRQLYGDTAPIPACA